MPKPESRDTIAVDIDEVLFPMAPTFLEYHNSTHGTDLRLDQMTSYYVEELTGETEEEMLAKIKEYLKTEHYINGQPIEGSIETIQKLRERFRVALVTSRDPFYRGSTEKFLDDHFTGLYDELYYTHEKEKPEVIIPKHTICRDIGAIALIDDSLANITACAQHGIEGILFGDYPWNQTSKLHKGVTRVKNWQEVAEYFDGKG